MSTEKAVDTAEPPQEIFVLLRRTNKKKPAKKDVEAMQAALHEYPDLWRTVGDLAGQAQRQIISMAADSELLTSSLHKGMHVMRREIGFEAAPPLEKLLIEQVLLTWLNYHRTQYQYEGHLHTSIPTAHRDYWDRHINAAQRRYLRAIETLARVRKLSGRGPIQINIAEQQVNVAG